MRRVALDVHKRFAEIAVHEDGGLRRLGRMAGAATELRIWQEAPHGFLNLPMSVTDVALAAEHEFLRRTLGLEG